MTIGSQNNLPSYEEALADPAKARVLFDASKGGNVRGITEDHRFELARAFQKAAPSLIEQKIVGFPEKPVYFSGLFGAVGVVVYLGHKHISPSWSVWMVPGCQDGM